MRYRPSYKSRIARILLYTFNERPISIGNIGGWGLISPSPPLTISVTKTNLKTNSKPNLRLLPGGPAYGGDRTKTGATR